MMNHGRHAHRFLVALAASVSILAGTVPNAWSLDGTVEAIQYDVKRQSLQINSSAPVEASLNSISVDGHKRIILDIENAEVGKAIPNDATLLKNLNTQFPALKAFSINQFGGSRPVVRILLDLQNEGYDVQLAKTTGSQLELKLLPATRISNEKPKGLPTASEPAAEGLNLGQAKRTIEEQQKIIAKLQEKLTELVNKPASIPSAPLTDEMKKTLVAMSQKYNILLKENQQLRQQLESPDPNGLKGIELKKLRDTNQTLQNEVVKLSQENNRLKQQQNPATPSEGIDNNAAVNAPLDLAKKELVNAIEVINRQNKEIADLKEHIEAVKLQVGASAKEQITLLNNKLEEKEAQLKAIQKSGQMLPTGKAQPPAVDVERLLTQLKQKDTQIITLTKQLNAASTKSAEEANTAKTLTEKEKQLETLTANLQDLQQKLAETERKPKVELQQLETQLKDRDEKIKTLTEQLKQVFKVKNDSPNPNEISYNDLKKTLVVLNKKYDELKGENEKLRTQLNTEQDRQKTAVEKLNAETNSNAIRYNDLKNTLALMNQKNEALKLENESLKGDLQRKATTAPSADPEAFKQLQNQLKTLQQEKEKTQTTQNTEMQAILKERIQLMQELESRAEQLKLLQERLTLQDKDLEAERLVNQKLQTSLNNRQDNANTTLSTIEKKLADLAKIHDTTVKENISLREQLKILQAPKPDNGEHTALLAVQKELSTEKTQAAQKIALLQQQLKEATEKNKTTTQELVQLKENLESLRKTSKTEDSGKAQLIQQLQDANKQLKQFQAKQETLTVAANATADLLKEKQELLKRLQDQQNQLTAFPNLKEENKQLSSRLEAQAQKLTALQAQLEKTKAASPEEFTQNPNYQKLRQQKEELATELSGLRGQVRELQEQLSKERNKKDVKGKPTFAKETAGTSQVNGLNREAENYFFDGKKADEEGDLTAAVEGYQKAYAISPENPKYTFALTTTMMALKNYQEAIRILQQFLAKDPQNRDAYNQLGKAYLLNGKSDEAQNAFSKAVHINALSNYATTLKKLGKLAEAERVLKVALALTPKDSDILFNLGNLYNSSNNLPAAQNAYEQAIQAKPDFAEAHYNLGLVCSKTGDKQNAIVHLEKYLQLSPEAANRTVVENYVKRLKGS